MMQTGRFKDVFGEAWGDRQSTFASLALPCCRDPSNHAVALRTISSQAAERLE